jgi:hypothetical protein
MIKIKLLINILIIMMIENILVLNNNTDLYKIMKKKIKLNLKYLILTLNILKKNFYNNKLIYIIK